MDNHVNKTFGDVHEVNRLAAAQLRAERLAEVSKRVREESMRVNAEFAAIEPDP
ncbi:MAG: hypothetical protein ABSF62_16100 [Bryobacteraceae bacterium]